MTGRERVLAAMCGKIPDRVPFMDLGVDHVVGQEIMGRPDYQPWELAEKLGMDAMGFGLYPNIYTVNRIAEDGRSYIVDGKLKTREDLAMVRLADPTTPGFLDFAKRFVDSKGDKAAWASTNIGLDPLLLGMGLEAFSYALMDDQQLIIDITKQYAEWTLALVQQLPAIGFDFIWYTDDLAYKDGPMFSPKVFSELLVPCVESTAKGTPLPWAFHSDGDLTPIIDDLLTLGMNALHPIEPGPMDIVQVKRNYGSRVCLIGNVSVDLLARGTQDEVKAEVARLVNDIAPGGGYIMSSSNSIASYCKAENVIAMAEAIEELGYY